ncbi:hypothetical protein GGR51DRAFT_557878 [Nemania sp. FL0031]|nr:hypothetical protein GGR51DRAFT_557878 [Nemania sp. FL0031]
MAMTVTVVVVAAQPQDVWLRLPGGKQEGIQRTELETLYSYFARATYRIFLIVAIYAGSKQNVNNHTKKLNRL